MGGTGVIANGKGIGGTGIDIANGKGTGGTGIRLEGDFAIYGRITGFGSICVNGIEIKYSAATPVQDNGQKLSAAELKLGEVVSVLASVSGDSLVAHNIAIDRIVTGRLMSLDRMRSTINVAGQNVIVSNIDTVARSLVPGKTISVSGFRNARGDVVATFIDRHPRTDAAPAPAPAISAAHVAIQGIVSRKDSAGLALGGTRIVIPESARVTGGNRNSIGENDRLIVIGRNSGSTVTADIVAVEHRLVPAELSVDMGGREINAPRPIELHGGRPGVEHDGEGPVTGHESPSVERPEVEKPEIEKPEIEKPEIERPETPESPEIERPDPPEPPSIDR
jgi:hypothetical protein